MYKIKENIDLSVLEKYGFKKGKDLPENDKWICNESEKEEYWLISIDPDEGYIIYAEDDLLLWSINVQSNRRLWIDCVPCCTYHICSADMEEMFYVLKKMIEDGILEDDYNG